MASSAEIDIDYPIFNENARFDTLEMILASYGQEIEDLLPKFKENLVQFRNLSQLSEEDLELLGVTNPTTRRRMVANFSDLPNQALSYEKLLVKVDTRSYNDKVLSGMVDHIKNMKNIALATHLKLYLKKLPPDIPLEDTRFASSFVITALDEIEGNINLMERALDTMEKKESVPLDESDTESMPKRYYVLSSLLGICLGLFVSIKLFKFKN